MALLLERLGLNKKEAKCILVLEKIYFDGADFKSD
jgi:hypothetical protein